MGRVLRCVDEQSGCEVAVKVIRDDLEDPIHRHRFSRECEAARRVHSKHVARALETGECPVHGTYLAMELLRGETLTKRLSDKGPMRVPDAIDLGIQLLDGLAAIHAAGVVHRDLKPSNVHVGVDAEGALHAVLFDFGVCSIPGTTPLGSQLTDPARPIGTLRYMAPEQIVRREAIGPSTDVYGWGCVMWVVLTAVRPFPKIERTSKLVEAIVKTNHAAPHTKRPELPRALSVWVARAMSVDPAARPSVAELRAALRELSDGTADVLKAPLRRSTYRPPPPPPLAAKLLRGPRRPKPLPTAKPLPKVTPKAKAKPVPVARPRPPAVPVPASVPAPPSASASASASVPVPVQSPDPRVRVPRQRTLVGQPQVEPLRPRRVFAAHRAPDLAPGRSSLPSWQLVRRDATPTQQRKVEQAALTTVLPGELNVGVLLGASAGVFGLVIVLLALAFS